MKYHSLFLPFITPMIYLKSVLSPVLPVTPQNVILTQNVITTAAKCNTNAKCNNIDAKCNNVFNAKCNNFSTQNVITFLTHNVITQNVITRTVFRNHYHNPASFT